MVREAREPDAEAVYERLIAGARDRVAVSTGLTWLVRHYHATGRSARAEQIARMAAETGSYGGFETLAHLFDAQGRNDDAEQLYRHIAERYGSTGPLGMFLVRKAQRTRDTALELQGWEQLREEFPNGMERLAMHALDVTPADGVLFLNFGRRAGAVGLRQTDIVVGIDEWRVRIRGAGRGGDASSS